LKKQDTNDKPDDKNASATKPPRERAASLMKSKNESGIVPSTATDQLRSVKGKNELNQTMKKQKRRQTEGISIEAASRELQNKSLDRSSD